MKLNPATLLVLIMFGSFVIILGVMIAIFRPEPTRPRPTAQKTRVAEPIPTRDLQDTLTTQTTLKDSIPSPSETKTVAKTSIKPKAVSPETSPTAQASKQVYSALEKERKEMAQLRVDLQKRLNAALTEHNQKLKQLARRCEPLEPGEAVQILLPLSDTDLATVLNYMQPAKATPMITLLKRNGRDKAIAKMK